MGRPRLLDLFCGAGGAGMGYHRAGFDVAGVDLNPQPNYPFEFIQYDLSGPDLEFDLDLFGFDAIHASPPCQLHSTQKTGVTREYQDLIPHTRAVLQNSGVPYIIENVVGAPLLDPIRLCGSMFGLTDGDTELRRHRLFECSFFALSPQCQHSKRRVMGIYGDMAEHDRPNRPITAKNKSHRGWKAGKARARRLMGIDWTVTDRELAEAIPPAYTEWIGRRLLGQWSD